MFILMLSNSLARAGMNAYSFADSFPADNLFVRVYYLTPGSTNIPTVEKINYCVLTKTNEIASIYFPKMDYLCQMQLFDSSGVTIPKTRSGEKYGEQFSNLKAYSWEAVNKKGHNTSGSIFGFPFSGNDRPDMALSRTNATEGRYLPSVQELFKIKEAGNYELLLQFQVFKLIQNGTNHTFRIVHIPPIRIPVIKMPES
jgi:hypothetical protein